jgi:hypothetical protein
VRRARRQDHYTPVLEDWLWHVYLPLVSYTAIAVAAIVLSAIPTQALFVIGAAAVLLLFIGIHNAWDNATFNVIQFSQPEDTGQDENNSLPSAQPDDAAGSSQLPSDAKHEWVDRAGAGLAEQIGDQGKGPSTIGQVVDKENWLPGQPRQRRLDGVRHDEGTVECAQPLGAV